MSIIDGGQNQPNLNLSQMQERASAIAREDLCRNLQERVPIDISNNLSPLRPAYFDNPPQGVPVERWRGLVETAVIVNSIAFLKQQPFYMRSGVDFYGEDTGFNQYEVYNHLLGGEINRVCEDYPALMATAAVMVRELCEVDPVRKKGFQLRLKQVEGKIDPQVEEKLANFVKYKNGLAQELVENGQVSTVEEAVILVSVASGVFVENSNLVVSADVTNEARSFATEHVIKKLVQAAKETYGGGCSWCETTMVKIDGNEKSVAEVLMTGSAEQISQIKFTEVDDIYIRYAVGSFREIINVGRKNKERKEVRKMEKQIAPKGRDFFGKPRR